MKDDNVNVSPNDKPDRVIVIRQDWHGVLVVVRIPDGHEAKVVFERWSSDPGVKDLLGEEGTEEAYWEELEVVDL